MVRPEDGAIRAFFGDRDDLSELFLDLDHHLLSRYPDLTLRQDKTQWCYRTKHPMLMVWLPIHEVKNRPASYMVLSLPLDHRLIDPAFVEVVEPYPGRFMHHLLYGPDTPLPEGFGDWLDQAYRFSQR